LRVPKRGLVDCPNIATEIASKNMTANNFFIG